MKYLVILILVFGVACSQSSITKTDGTSYSPLFSDGMILQQKESVAIWGESEPNQKINVIGSWGTNADAISDSNGKWSTYLKTPEAGGPFQVEIKSGISRKLIKDVLIGEVWLAAGQSNMEMDFDYCCNSTDQSEVEISTADFPQIRMLNVEKQLSKQPTKTFTGSWEKAVDTNITNFSAPGYFFAKKLHNELKVPIGIIHSSWGGTDAESWTSRDKLNSLGYFDESFKNADDLVDNAEKSEQWFSQFESVKLPSDVWYLTTGDYFGFPDKWRNLDFKDEEYIQNSKDDNHWKDIELPGTIDNIFNTNDFNGVILVKKKFKLDDIKGDYSIRLGAVEHMDFTYINGVLIESTIGKKSAKTKEYKISKSNLKIGENTIVIRVLNNYGTGNIGEVTLQSTIEGDKPLTGTWKYRVSGEIYRQMDSFEWPYTALYLYNKENVNFSDSPSVAKYHPNVKYALYNGMIYPIIPYNIKGVLWYQGENNVQRHEQYESLFTAMITDWRERWNDDFPFYFVQISPFYNYGGLSSSLREAQRKSLKLPNTGMVVTLDIGENYDIHPSNKHDVGNRLAGLALADNYGKKNVASGPLYKNHEISGNKVFVNFDHVGSGLIFKENESNGLEFEIAGMDGKFVTAKARIKTNRIEVFSPNVLKPMQVRNAWSDTTSATLFNMEGLPASSFSTEH